MLIYRNNVEGGGGFPYLLTRSNGGCGGIRPRLRIPPL